MQTATKTIMGLFIIGFFGIVFLIMYGNLSGNLGFAANTAGANNTEAVISNMTAGAVTFYGFAPTWFTIAAIALLLVILIGLLLLIVNVSKKIQGKNTGFGG